MTDWANSIAFVTGGGQGIGLGIARALIKRGVHVAIADVNESALESAKADLTAAGGVVATYRLDVRDRAAYIEVADRVESELGPVNLLFNNAGIAPTLGLAELSFDAWDVALGVNLYGVVNGLQVFLPRMIERGQGGYVVNTASGAGFISAAGILYTAAKHAVVGLSEALKPEAAQYGIGVSVLCPGIVATDIMKHTQEIAGDLRLVPDAIGEETGQALAAGTAPDAVGEMVIAGMEADATWIQTDAMIVPYLRQRVEAVLASFPAA